MSAKSAALECLAANKYSVEKMVGDLLKFRRGTTMALENNGATYEFHVVGISVNFELWCTINGAPSIEIGFVSDH